ncbi:hypothetical protein [Photobacterium sp. 53610]|uniref:hypothetical protein n=1 Tax=Photobacterium sp. 53610 TaxID=3102789 RepID=UPI002EDAFD1C
MSSDNIFVLLEAKEHMISEDTKKTKFVFLFSCVVTIALCIFHKAEIHTLFGMIRLSPESKIPLIVLVIPSFIISLYQFFLYNHYYEESIENWKNKKNNSTKDKNGNDKESDYKVISFSFNEIIKEFNHLTSEIDSPPPTSPTKKIEDDIEKLNNEVSELITRLESHNPLKNNARNSGKWVKGRKDTFSGSSVLESAIEDLHLIERFVTNACEKEDVSKDKFEIKSRLDDIETLLNRTIYTNEMYNESNTLHDILSRTFGLSDELKHKYFQLESDFHRDHKARLEKMQAKWFACEEKRDAALNHIKRLSIDEQSNYFIFRWIPFCFIFFTGLISSYVIISNWALFTSSYAMLNFFTN